MKQIDINADMGESFGHWTLGADEELIEHISSANIACGFHAGDWEVMSRTVALALRHGVAVGAHLSYPDLQGFGRRHMTMHPAEITQLVLYQVGALWAIARSLGAEISHVKPHGALYHDAMHDADCAQAIALGIKGFSSGVFVFCLPNSKLEAAAQECGLMTCAEGFADRLYEPNGSLADRNITDSVLSVDDAVRQGISLANGSVVTRNGSTIELTVGTLCIHGDSPRAPVTARHLRQSLEAAGYAITSPRATIDT